MPPRGAGLGAALVLVRRGWGHRWTALPSWWRRLFGSGVAPVEAGLVWPPSGAGLAGGHTGGWLVEGLGLLGDRGGLNGGGPLFG